MQVVVCRSQLVKQNISQICSNVTRSVGIQRRSKSTYLKRTTIIQNSLDSQSTIAVSQQAAAYAAVIAAEGFFTRSQMKEDNPGRPSIIPIAASAVAIIISLALLQNDSTQSVGCILGLVISVAMLGLYVRRISVTKGSPEDWPGPKVWPGTMILISFFALNVYFQALK
eukprot:TRINITY_DN2275_c0_g1_i1.p2 TRINITY_DN2275_c0_g1~~TRINITY_DN2275_c0_g1_i1.p2  ORF type:complete len:169 (-),score=17.71 TRINITY_DN2275_c0_g1_i1:357-863(-)